MLDVADKHVRKRLEAGGPNTRPKWSPDGKEIAFVTAAGQPFFYANRRIAVASADTGPPRILTDAFDEDASLIDWGPDGIYFAAFQKTAAHVFRLDPATRAIRRISSPDQFHLPDASFTKDHRMMAGVGAAPNHFAEVLVSSTGDFAPKYLTDMASQYKEFQLTTREVVQWKSTDGTVIEGVLIKPAGYDPSRKYPLLVVIFTAVPPAPTRPCLLGRPLPIRSSALPPRARSHSEGQLSRGSAGYGEKLLVALNVRNLGLGDYQDVISGVDALIAKSIVDTGWAQWVGARAGTFRRSSHATAIASRPSRWAPGFPTGRRIT